MEPLQALARAIATSGLSKYAVSKRLGKTQAYIGAMFSRGSVPKTDTYATIADVCGYDLLLRKRDDSSEILVDPSSRRHE